MRHPIQKLFELLNMKEESMDASLSDGRSGVMA